LFYGTDEKMMSGKAVISSESLTKKFGTFTAVDQISFEVRKGEIFGFLGANGAGKTTAMKMFCGLLKPTSGIGSVAGFDIFTESEKIKKRIGYMSQKFSLYEDLTVNENIQFYAGIYGLDRGTIRRKQKELSEKLQLDAFKDKLISSLPLGWKQKLAFSVAIVHEPDIVFLDEPTGGVDPVTRRQFWDLIYEAADSGVTVFVTTHYMDEAEYCDRISMMVDGRIEAIGSTEHLKEKYKVDSMNEVFLILARNIET
jgi:ABC-2 type transport system ATP-binding protein